jgi:hypothetical protein
MNASPLIRSIGFRRLGLYASSVARRLFLGNLAALLAAAHVFVAAQANAYSLTGASWPPGSTVLFQLNLGDANTTLDDGNTSWNAAVQPALEMWSQNILRIQTTGVTNSPVSATSGDRINSVVFSSTIFGQTFGRNTLAVAYYRTLGSNLTEADILFNVAQSFNSYRGPLKFAGNGTVIADIRRVFLHETGHAIGLNHPDGAGQTVDAVMNSITSNRSVLAQDDINGAQFLYGAPLIAPTPTPTPIPSSTPTPTPGSTPTVSHLVNISTRLNVGVASDVMIGGFIISGSAPKKLILRALGPSLASVGISGAMQNPSLALHDSSGASIASNDNWQTGGQRDEIIATGVPPQNDLESAIVATLSPGNYTAVLQGVNETSGIAIVEAYELDSNSTRLVNISTRGRVGLDQNAMIGGFIVQYGVQKRVIVRALGPSLNSGGSSLQGELVDPTLELYNGDGALLAANDDWVDSPQYAEIVASTVPPTDSRESAVVANLPPGNFTAIVRGANFTQGIGLVEVYDLNP